MDYSNINYLAVLVCAVIAFVLGAIWYSALFGKIWQKEVSLTNQELKNANMFQIFGSSFILMLVMIFGLAVLLNMTVRNENGFMGGFTFGLWVGVIFNAASYGINMLYQRKSIKLWLIDSCYQILFLAISGGILSIWK
ncbi:MAG TPA: DUF1761 domain-containing protein [Chitinophagales bacterium]|nr:DUF1761 domain-containing protein [Chitinophagales bacterium]